MLQQLMCLGCGRVISHTYHEQGEELAGCPACHAEAFTLSRFPPGAVLTDQEREMVRREAVRVLAAKEPR